MRSRVLLISALLAGTVSILQAQDIQMRATYRGGGDRNQGKCTVDLVVDGAVDIEIRGDVANLRSLGGRPARPRRFECTGPIPARPANFRFDPQEGRGRQTLIRDPRDGGPLVVRIEDKDPGTEGYKFDFYWDGSRGPGYAGPQSGGYGAWHDSDDYHRDRNSYYQGNDWRRQLFGRVRQDVAHVQAGFQSDDDRRRLYRVIRELDELQGQLTAGRYNEREFDDVIGALDRVLSENRLSRQDGEVLSDDLKRLREFRARHDDYGAR